MFHFFKEIYKINKALFAFYPPLLGGFHANASIFVPLFFNFRKPIGFMYQGNGNNFFTNRIMFKE